MIQPLRTAHRQIFFVLALVLPMIIVSGLAARRPPLGATTAERMIAPFFYMVRKSDKLWAKHAILSEFFGDTRNANAVYVSLRPIQPLDDPDLLLYWTNTAIEKGSLPADAQLLGVFNDAAVLKLPANAGHHGYLVLYSLAHQAVIDSASVEKLP